MQFLFHISYKTLKLVCSHFFVHFRLWDVESGHPLQRMSTGRVEKNLETTVWSVIILNDFTIVSGDSRGKTSFWNGNTGKLAKQVSYTLAF